MDFIGDKTQIYTGELPATSIYPALKLSDFQGMFQFLSNESELNLTHQLTAARAAIRSELKPLMATLKNDTDRPDLTLLSVLSLMHFEDEETAKVFYIQSVFALAASYIVSVQISTDATKEAADRQQALSNKKEECLVMYRRAVDMLIYGHETRMFEVL
ncbi:head completion/stabilization protein [Vibrio sp. OPT18]|uniref:head completion/stabilization protein n=1 Tax=Vibrio sp. OPT18 TaxID=2778641 RepID=UPI001880040B|nr:head completion/stabilization protein [Vibrio sp. OPT18]MBE8574456.1 head completion/stabilization protein [Vibrio sp. OPT18]